MQDMTTTLDDFIDAHSITAEVERAADNPNMDDDGTPMNHYRVTLAHDGDDMVVPFSTGIGWTRDPTAADVLDCLASDATGVENAPSFDAWCAEYGYDTDSRRAFSTWEACKRQADELRTLLGPTAYRTLLWDTERP